MYATSTAVLRLLVEHGANPNAEESDGNTVLMCAAKYRDADAVEYLLSKGVHPQEKNKDGLTALDFVRKAGKKENIQILEKVNIKDSD